MSKNKKILLIIIINIIIFAIANITLGLRYEQVDDMIIYNLYSNLDGTSNVYGIYIHPIICFILGTLFNLLPHINWHTIFLLICQFVSFTIIGYICLKKAEKPISFIFYAIFASCFYTILLLLIQYTSVAILIITVAFIMLIDLIESNEKKSLGYRILMFLIFALGVMLRSNSVVVVLPFLGIYFLHIIWQSSKKTLSKEKVISFIKYIVVSAIIFIVIQVIYWLVYSFNPTYKEYFEYNKLRTQITDSIELNYTKDKEIYDEIGWSGGDYTLIYTFNFGDENIFSKENFQKLIDYKVSKHEGHYLNINVFSVIPLFIDEIIRFYLIPFLLISLIFICCIRKNPEKIGLNTFTLLVTYGIHILFIVIGRSIYRVVMPVYIIRNRDDAIQFEN